MKSPLESDSVSEVALPKSSVTRSLMFGIGGKVVVVGRYLDFARLQLLHGMISAMVAEFQLIGLSPQSNSYELMPQANSEYRLPSHETFYVVHRIRAWLGVARTIGQEHSIRF